MFEKLSLCFPEKAILITFVSSPSVPYRERMLVSVDDLTYYIANSFASVVQGALKALELENTSLRLPGLRKMRPNVRDVSECQFDVETKFYRNKKTRSTMK